MLYHRVADAKGMTLKTFLESHTSQELTEIIARDRLDPYDHIGRIELIGAKVLAMLFNINRDSNRSEALSSSEFLPKYGETYREEVENIMTPEQMKAKMAKLRK
jgi:hypothetical protein